MRGKFNFRYVDILFDVTKCKFIVKNSSFKMLVMFSPIFVADTKITFVYNFVAPLGAEIVVKPVIFGILPSISVILAS